jgi:hypothetical protein
MEGREKLPKIFISAKTGFIIRNLILGYFIKELQDRARLVLAVQNPDDMELKKLLSHPNITLVKYIQEEYPVTTHSYERLKFLQYWMFYVMLAKNPTESLKIYSRLEDATFSWFVWFIQKSLFMFGKTVNALGLRRAFERYYLWHYGRRQNTNDWVQLLREHKPDHVLSTMLSLSLKYTPSDDLPMVLAARKLGIKVSTLIQSWDNLSTKPTVLPEWVDKYFTWSHEQTRELCERFPHVQKNKVMAVGSPQFDFHVQDAIMVSRKEFLTELGLDAGKPYILIGTGTPKTIPDEIDKVINLIRLLLPLYPDMQFVIRLHPKDYSNRLDIYKDELPRLRTMVQKTNAAMHMDEGGFMPPLEFYRDQVNVLRHSELVLNSSSTLTVDAAIVDKPVICLAYDLITDEKFPLGRAYVYSQSDHYKKLADSGGVWVVRSKDECLEAMKQYLENPELHREKRRELAELVTLMPAGNAGKRLADKLYEIAVQSS